ncbi:hypothetical protein ACFQY0_12950 [Haloferula chungangensis]|uniref:Uncharacterized protein n=1 Tax=Haloferula chungangensis TaxID=1048331 RepID=A0ABW2L8M6_9BACT
MKHLFFVHSFASYHCALRVIDYEGLEGEDCVFVCARDFVCPNPPPNSVQTIARFRQTMGMLSLREVLRGIRSGKDADKEISKLAGANGFHAYIPHSYYAPIQWALSHPLCEGYSYIEEGLTSYYGLKEIAKAYPPRKPPYKAGVACRILFGKRTPKIFTFFQEGYTKVYGFFDTSFPSWKRRHTVGPPEHMARKRDRAKNQCPLLVFDTLVELGMCSADVLEKALSDFLEILVDSGVHELRYKLHPGQLEESRESVSRVFGAFSERVSFEELARSVSLEQIFHEEDCDVYVFNSAAGMYAAQAGQRVFTINELVSQYDPEYSEKVSRFPAIYHELVMPISIARGSGMPASV